MNTSWPEPPPGSVVRVTYTVRYAVWNGPGPRPQDTFYAFKPPDFEEWISNRTHGTVTWEELTSTDKWTFASIDQVEVVTGWRVLEPANPGDRR